MDVRLFVMITAWWIGGKARVTFGRRGSDTVVAAVSVEVVAGRGEKPYNAAERGEFGQNIWNINSKRQTDNLGANVFGSRLNVCFIYLFLYPLKQISANKLSWYSPPVTWRLCYFLLYSLQYVIGSTLLAMVFFFSRT